jgi:FlaG/FlaF family flagellin (archaellin)
MYHSLVPDIFKKQVICVGFSAYRRFWRCLSGEFLLHTSSVIMTVILLSGCTTVNQAVKPLSGYDLVVQGYNVRLKQFDRSLAGSESTDENGFLELHKQLINSTNVTSGIMRINTNAQNNISIKTGAD